MATETTARPAAAADPDKIAAIRAELPAVHERIYLNTGTNGPLPRRAHDALTDYCLIELTEGRIGPAVFARAAELKTATRASLAPCSAATPAKSP